eukprot:361211-Chlamydomonas_euryale.AAC.1
MPTSPLSLNVELKDVHEWAHAYCVSTRVYSRECMPLPGPPAVRVAVLRHAHCIALELAGMWQ